MMQTRKAIGRRVRRLAHGRPFGVALLAAALAIAMPLLAGFVRNVSIIDGGREYHFRTGCDDVAQVLALADVDYTERDEIRADADGKALTISIARAVPVLITVGKRSETVELVPGTVADALAALGIVPDEYDIINLPLETPLTENLAIDVVDIGYETETVTEEIPYGRKTVYSDQYEVGKTMQTAGKAGKREVVYQKTLVNGEVTDVKVLSEKVVLAAVDAETVIGTKAASKPATSKPAASKPASAAVTDSAAVQTISQMKPPFDIPLDAAGNPVNYKKHMTVQATAYTYVKGAANICSTGVKAQTGYIAVNPKVIPYGTKMYIKSSDGRFLYGYAVAADTGGFVKKYPTNVDLFFNTYNECAQFGRRNVEIYILE